MNRKKLKQKNRELKAKVLRMEQAIKSLGTLKTPTHTSTGSCIKEHMKVRREIRESILMPPEVCLEKLEEWAVDKYLKNKD